MDRTDDWVKAAMHIAIWDSLFSDLHKKAVDDICSMNDLPPKFRRDFAFSVKPTQPNKFAITERHDTRRILLVRSRNSAYHETVEFEIVLHCNQHYDQSESKRDIRTGSKMRLKGRVSVIFISTAKDTP